MFINHYEIMLDNIFFNNHILHIFIIDLINIGVFYYFEYFV